MNGSQFVRLILLVSLVVNRREAMAASVGAASAAAVRPSRPGSSTVTSLGRQQTQQEGGHRRNVDQSTASCSEGKQRCIEDTACKSLLDSVERFCDQSIYTCQTPDRSQCQTVLSSLQTNVHFEKCVCDPADQRSNECLTVQTRIFFHSCVTTEAGASPNVSWIVPSSNYYASSGDFDDDIIDSDDDSLLESRAGGLDSDIDQDGGDLGDLQSGSTGALSCIGVRKTCLKDIVCRRALDDFRKYCTENKRTNVCTASEWTTCHRATAELRTIVPSIFLCSCAMKRSEIRDRCSRIRSRISGNNCLVTIPYLQNAVSLPEYSFDQLVRIASSADVTSVTSLDHGGHVGLSCLKAFTDCVNSETCRTRLSHVTNSCSWLDPISTVTGRRTETNSSLTGSMCAAADDSIADNDDVTDTVEFRHDGGNELLTPTRRRTCLDAVQTLFDEEDDAIGQSLVFCRCPDGGSNRSTDNIGPTSTQSPPGGNIHTMSSFIGIKATAPSACEAVQRAIRPACSLVELPPPSCSILLRRCLYDLDCRSRLEDYETSCSYDKRLGGCQSNERCRHAVVKLMGTILTTSCTCLSVGGPSSAIQRQCMEAQRRLPLQQNVCEDISVDDFHSQYLAKHDLKSGRQPNSKLPSETVAITTPLTAGSRANSAAVSFVTDRHLQSHGEHVCTLLRASVQGGLPKTSTLNISTSSTTMIRVYNGRHSNGSVVGDDCSELCRCPLPHGAQNRTAANLQTAGGSSVTAVCTSMLCLPSTSCKHLNKTYEHGSAFNDNARGQCRCVKSEVVCPKSTFLRMSQEGLFLHVGFSLVEKQLIERDSHLAINPNEFLNRLSPLLNGGLMPSSTPGYQCSLIHKGEHDGNVVFEIVPQLRRGAEGPNSQLCDEQAKALRTYLSTRHTSTYIDAVLSVIKVAQLERVHHSNQHAPASSHGLSGRYEAGSYMHSTSGGDSKMLSKLSKTAYCFVISVIAVLVILVTLFNHDCELV